MKTIVTRFKQRTEHGVTLVELAVGILIFGLVSIIIFNIFQTTNKTAINVRNSTHAASTIQLVTNQINKEVRNARALNVDDNQLLINRADSTCVTYYLEDNTLYSATEGTNPKIKTHVENVSLQDGTPLFTAIPHGVQYSLATGNGVSRVLAEGRATMRLPDTSIDASDCLN